MSAGLFSGIHGWHLGLVLLALMLVAGELGFRFGRRSPRTDDDTKTNIVAVEAGILGVLGLLLGFTLFMAVSRYDIRKQLVLDEANALGTAYWRAQLVPAPEGTELANLLREYVDTKVHYFDAGLDSYHLSVSRSRIARLQSELWMRAADFARKDPRSIPAGLLLESLNQTFDLDSSRWTALVVHVPEGVIGLDGFIGLVVVFLVGYTFGLDDRRHGLSVGLLALCIATVMFLIVDLDQPRRGLIRVSQEPLVDLQRQIGGKR